ncbi:DEAD/DEAH box helicase [Phaeobacter gallaeciensis]|uniref:DEAD/DEAH box helicase n=1 Tax=Phaeobacter gallaeciensis TaxID=60890 RepID=UPI00237F6BA4|nr:DEAD/DEAH box helicase [Phaeobacter gallaeciensis]MDE4302089.1 DEAD/DEAH box helicase [Phaeobacter gallaeciensis]MDE4306934.1 DEAD/DEAH box helicase [Phaeobacter gallaeciensis]MDE4310947.1 DEAD/DEAH box helicase [Phaeobacter gallaeciensis]MDE4315410.1 DEAD/DEAH box helicase [Phaeobacter gallaeciensis]MDE4319874.1 DEAD/DEAH box helicase [Phaeobacter gallaeciensis]
MIEELAERIWSNPKFHDDTSNLRNLVFSDMFGFDGAAPEVGERNLMLRRLTSSALTLACSERSELRKRSYEIATGISEYASQTHPGSVYALLLALSRLGNFPAMEFAKRRYEVSEFALPQRTIAENSARRQHNSVTLGAQDFSLTDFQFGLWNKLSSQRTIGISAPTSAGKSFVLQFYARKLFEKEQISYASILVPSRALITQVSEDVSSWLTNSGLEVELITTPIPAEGKLPAKAVFVVTQERMQLLLSAHPNLSPELVVVDEAQNLGDGPRGVLLSAVIEESLRRFDKCQLVFAGPNLSAPEKLAHGFAREAVPVSTDEPTVAQNIFFLDTGNTDQYSAKVSFWNDGQPLELGTVGCDQPLQDHKSKLVNLGLRLGGNGQSLFYAYGPSECEEIAFGLSDVEGREPTPAQEELSKFVKEAVHPDFQLASFVRQGVGYHYGRLPSLVRKAIEDAFSEGNLNYLVTTSTLLQGVNLPARNLFLHNPRKGDDPISSVDFWNLAGRAGRLGKEFSGNIFLIDYGSWEADPLSGTSDREVEPTLLSHLSSQADGLIDYIKDRDRVPDPRVQDEYENTFVKLVQDQMKGRLSETLSRAGLDEGNQTRIELQASIVKALDEVDLDEKTISSTPTVSIYKQQSLLDRLEKSLKAKGPDYVIPKHPRDSYAYHSYIAVLQRCHQEILKLPKKDKSAKYFTQLILRWMRGDPLPMIIDANLKYNQDRGIKSNTATVIRKTLTEIENDVRFKYVRLFSCYNAVLEFALRKHGYEDSIKSIPAIPVYLEMGASSVSMMSFIGLGLSRFTSTQLQRLARRVDMSQEEARLWVRRQNVDALDIPSASAKEIRRLFQAA